MSNLLQIDRFARRLTRGARQKRRLSQGNQADRDVPFTVHCSAGSSSVAGVSSRPHGLAAAGRHEAAHDVTSVLRTPMPHDDISIKKSDTEETIQTSLVGWPCVLALRADARYCGSSLISVK